jgi:hypothetical protein
MCSVVRLRGWSAHGRRRKSRRLVAEAVGPGMGPGRGSRDGEDRESGDQSHGVGEPRCAFGPDGAVTETPDGEDFYLAARPRRGPCLCGRSPYLSDGCAPAVNHSSVRDRSSLTYCRPSAAALSFWSEVSQRFLMSREAIGAASLPRPLKLTSSCTCTEVPVGDGVRL